MRFYCHFHRYYLIASCPIGLSCYIPRLIIKERERETRYLTFCEVILFRSRFLLLLTEAPHVRLIQQSKLAYNTKESNQSAIGIYVCMYVCMYALMWRLVDVMTRDQIRALSSKEEKEDQEGKTVEGEFIHTFPAGFIHSNCQALLPSAVCWLSPPFLEISHMSHKFVWFATDRSNVGQIP